MQIESITTSSAIQPIATWKRLLDILCVITILPLALPLMAIIALWIRSVSHGPALFRQVRIGHKGKSFILYKFRSMKSNADTKRHKCHFRNLVRSDSPMVKLDLLCDTRMIPGAGLLRASGLDELPQLINVLRGEMSLVGPRPCLADELRYYTANQCKRFETLPGMTGFWQVHGMSTTTFNEMVAMDLLYVQNSSLKMDLTIMLQTPTALIRQIRKSLQQHKIVNGEYRHVVTNGSATREYQNRQLECAQ